MTLDKLVLHNFGVYRGRHEIVLTPISAAKPITLIGALNGSGKTTLLEALQLALYGKQARIAGREDVAYDEYLRRSINRWVEPREGSAIELEFRHLEDGIERQYRVHRSWRLVSNSLRERFEVWRDELFDPALTDQWAEHVESLLPVQLSHLFFFDGEEVQAFAAPEGSKEVLRTAIHALLGLDVVDQLDVDLAVLERRRRVEQSDGQLQLEVAAVEAAIDRLVQQSSTDQQECGAVQNEVDKAEQRCREADERFRQGGGEAFDQRENLETERALAARDVAELEVALRRFAEGDAPLLLVTPLLRQVGQQVQNENRAVEQQQLSSLLEQRDEQLLDIARQVRVPSAALKKLTAYLQGDRAERVGSTVPRILGLGESAARDLQSLLSRDLGQLQEQVRSTSSDLTAARSRLVQADRRLSAVPDTDSLTSLIREREKAQQQLQAANDRLSESRVRHESTGRELERQRTRLSALLDADTTQRFADEDTERTLEHAGRVRGTLAKFRAAVLARRLGTLEALILESFQGLVRKERLIQRLRIVADDFRLELEGEHGVVVPAEKLSAGERQLLAVSILWGLAKASGRVLPAVIDTPLGRLDSHHRGHLVSRYFPCASHQVVLLSTDEEVNDRYYKQLRPWVGRSYRLEFDAVVGGTQPVEGYFWEVSNDAG